MYSDTLSNGLHVASGVPGASMYSGTHIHMHGKGDDPNFISRQRESPVAAISLDFFMLLYIAFERNMSR